MAKAISQSPSYEGTHLGSFLLSSVGVDITQKNKKGKKTKFEKLINKYQKELTEKAKASSDWYPFAKYLKVILENNRDIRVVFEGPSYEEERAMLIEYGTGTTVANPLMRVSEAEFGSDFDAKRIFEA